MSYKKSKVLIGLLVYCCSHASWGAGFGINATRIIYHEHSPSVQVTMRNTTANTVYLVRSTVVDAAGKNVNGFVVLPPLFRLDPGNEGSVRVAYQPSLPLSKEHESVFYFKAVAIPNTNPLSKEGRAMVGQVQLAVGNQIKLFYRPSGVADPDKTTFKNLGISRVPAGIKVENPTPYYLTLAKMSVDGKPVSMERQNTMIPPFGSKIYLSTSRNKAVAKWGVINDLGGVDEYSSIIL